MNLSTSIKRVSLLFCVLSLSSCAALDIKPWSAEGVVDGFITSLITGKTTSYGNKATCNHFKMVGGSTYREWTKDGEIACSYGD